LVDDAKRVAPTPKDIRISHDIEQGSFTLPLTVQDLFRTQIVVDEAMDFSPTQLACMKDSCDPAANSFFACLEDAETEARDQCRVGRDTFASSSGARPALNSL
jgi:hypothetical protein